MARSDGSTASYYELPPEAKELQDLIAFKNMNAQMGEIFRANYRYGEVEHSEKLRDINKILFYAQAEKARLLKYEGYGKVEEAPAEINWAEELRGVPSASGETEESETEGQETLELESEVQTWARLESRHKTPRPICVPCNAEIEGRIYYLGNAPRCARHKTIRPIYV